MQGIQVSSEFEWNRVLEATARAQARGAQEPIPTRGVVVEQDGVTFLLRVVTQLERKRIASLGRPELGADGHPKNPFLPYDPEMYVADLTATHVCLLNKFNVVDHHVLVVTRRFEEQQSVLSAEDFEAMWVCLDACDGLAFYNAGEAAGASQRHKHLQHVPLPLAASGPRIPLECKLVADRGGGELPFLHAVEKLDDLGKESRAQRARLTRERYLRLLVELSLVGDAGRTSPEETRPYNLLCTRQWLALVPRSCESYGAISVNALGYAGAFLVRDEAEMRELIDAGLMRVLGHTGVDARSRDVCG